MALERISLFSSKKDFFLFLALCFFILTYSLLIEYNNYKNFTKFDSQLFNATVVKQYTKTKLSKKGVLKEYQVLQLKSKQGFKLYTIQHNLETSLEGKEVQIEIFSTDITFYEYMRSFFSFSYIVSIDDEVSLKTMLNQNIESSHNDANISKIYKALYTATPLSYELQQKFATLGISHLLAISGFHLGVLSTLLFFLFKYPYKYLQNRYFPYRSYKLDSFIFIGTTLLAYLLFLDVPPSLLRAYVMLLIGFGLYDRHYKIISMWTLFLTIIIILSFSPRLLFSLGFWLSVAGVFYIFLFLIHFKYLHNIWQFILVPFWVYLMMLPLSLYIFEIFSTFHPLSIIWTSLFTLFYPLSIVLHLLNYGEALDNALLWILQLEVKSIHVSLPWELFILFIGTSLLSLWKKYFLLLLFVLSLLIFVYSVYNVA